MARLRSTLRPGERVLFSTRQHGRRLVLPALCFILLAGAFAFLLQVVPDSPWSPLWWTLLGLLLGWLAYALSLRPYLSWLSVSYSLTTERVVARRGFFRHGRIDADFRSIDHLALAGGPARGWTRSGDVVVHFSGSRRPLRLRAVPEAARFCDVLEAHRRMPSPRPGAPLQGSGVGDHG